MASTERSESGGVSEGTADLCAGDLLSERYRIEGKLGVGGIGIVYRAVQLPLARPVAIKVLHDDLLSLYELRARFEREARVLSALTHPHVVSISDYGIDGERPFLVMELLEGQTLEEVVRRDPIDPSRALHLARQILSGLAFAHEKGIAHRDLKPANVFLSRMSDGMEHIKLLDFGLARVVEGAEDEDIALTKRGVVFGTPAYMSPEQAAGASADARSDVYSAGVLLFELLAGRRPYVGDTRADLLRAHLSAPVPRLASVRPELRARPDLVSLIEIAMAKEPGDRYQTASEMLFALDAIEQPAAWLVPEDEVSIAVTQTAGRPAVRPEEPPAPRRSWLLAMVVGLVAAAALTVVLVFGWSGPDGTTASGELPVAAPPDLPAARVRAVDPWAEPPPEPLRPFLAMVETQRVFEDRAEIRPLYALAREMPDDARPLLLLGHLFVAKGWYTEGIRRYSMAAERDPSIRGDDRMLRSLVELAARDSVGDRAAEVVEAVYGVEALSAVEDGIAATAEEPLSQLRLVRLRERLSAIPGA